jgi:hypothetical protein
MEAVDRPEDVARALDVARRSITVLRNEGGVLPLHADQPLRILHLVLSSDARNDAITGIPEAELAARRIPTQTFVLGPEVAPDTASRIVAAAPGFTHVIASAFVRVSAYKGNADMAESHARLLRDLQAAGRPVVLVSFGSPYLLRQVPSVSAYVSAYGGADSSQRAAVAALFGEYPVSGKVPVSLPGLLCIRRRAPDPEARDDAARGRAGEAGFRPDGLAEVDRVVEAAVAARAFPGAVLAVGKDGAARAPAALRPSLLRRRARRARGHDVRPGQPHQGHRHDHHGHDPGGRGQARHQQARLRVPARVPRRGQGQGHGLAPPDPLVGRRLVGAPLQGAEGQGRLPQARPGHGPRLRAGHEVRLQRSWASSSWARSWSAWPDRTSTRSRARGCSGRWA